MDKKVVVGIVGYGNLGKGVETAIKQNQDFELKAIFTRRKSDELDASAKGVNLSEIDNYKGLIDVMILCGGSATDLPEQAPRIAAMFNTVDSFDTHASISEYFGVMDKVSKKAGTISLISVGWDPGLFSMYRLLGQTILPDGKEYTFWGKGVSQGHSDAIRRIPGVKNGIQYTVPIKEAIDIVRLDHTPNLYAGKKHERICYVVPEPCADQEKIANSIRSMPNYFSDYNTTIHFITEEELKKNHSDMPHGGFVIRSGITGEKTRQRMEFSLSLDSNPEFTASVLVAYVRAVYKLAAQGHTGAMTVFDIPLGYLSPKTEDQLRKELL